MKRPQDVTSPKKYLQDPRVVYDHDPGSAGDPMDAFAVADVIWCDNQRLAMRWNCVEGRPFGNPSSRNFPTWFIIPDQFAPDIAARTIELLETATNMSPEEKRDAVERLNKWARAPR